MSRSADAPASEAIVREAARAGDYDRYLAALLAPRRARRDLIALTAFLGEIARIPALVSEPMMGEVRLQWWRDALQTVAAGGRTGNPVADALGPVIVRQALPAALITSVIDARASDLGPDRFDVAGRAQDLADYFALSEGSAFQLGARILEVKESPETDGLIEAAAQAYGAARFALGAAHAGGAGGLRREAEMWLKEARERARAAPRAAIAAVLPVALVEPYLEVLQRLGPEPAREEADISPLTRVWRLWQASRLGRI